MKKWVFAGVVLVAVIVAALMVRDWYFNDKPVDMADEHREDAELAAASITGSMDRVYDSFDDYLRATTFPANRFKNVDDVGELRRRLIPVLDDADDALIAARNRIDAARQRVKQDRDDLLETPTAKYLEDAEPIVETEEVADESREYLKRAERYLKSFDKYLDYEEKDIDLRRRELKIAAQNEPSPDADLAEFESTVAAQLEETKALLKARLKLEPARDTEKLNENSIEYVNVAIDYLERIQAAFDALDLAGLKAADADYIDEVRRVGNRSSELLAELSADSGLSSSARSLSKRADDLQDAIAELGSGEPRDAEPRKRPPPLPQPPAGGDGGDAGGDDSQVS
jgi:hypothetical protein